MFDEVKRYLLLIRLRLEKNEREGIPTDMLMEEISEIAINNWVERDDMTPDLTDEQFFKATTRVIARIYNRN